MPKSAFSKEVTLTDLITPLDWVVFSLIIILTLASIFYGQRLKKNNKLNEKENFLDLLLMGRRLTLPLFTATLVATWYGGIFGVTKIAFEKGIFNFVTQGVFWYVAYLIFAFFLVEKISNYKAVTLPDLINKMFGPKSSFLSAIFNFFNILPIVYVISLGIFLQLILGGTLWANMLGGVSFVTLYSFFGGFRTVVFSDLVQFLVMCIGVFLILLLSVTTFGGFSFLTSNLPPTYFELTGGESLGTTFVWGLIALSTLVDPNFYQRVFAASSNATAKKGIILSTFIWLCFDICTTLGAMYAKAVIPEADSSTAYLTYAVQLLPSGVRGLVLAGILATILSTLDSYLFLAGTTLGFDLVPKKYKGRASIHHLGVISVGLIAIVMALVFEGNIKTVWKTLGSYSASCLLLPVIFGYIFPSKIKDLQFVTASLLGVIAITYWRNASHVGFWSQVDELYVGMLATSLGRLLYRFIEKPLHSLFRPKAP